MLSYSSPACRIQIKIKYRDNSKKKEAHPTIIHSSNIDGLFLLRCDKAVREEPDHRTNLRAGSDSFPVR